MNSSASPGAARGRPLRACRVSTSTIIAPSMHTSKTRMRTSSRRLGPRYGMVWCGLYSYSSLNRLIKKQSSAFSSHSKVWLKSIGYRLTIITHMLTHATTDTPMHTAMISTLPSLDILIHPNPDILAHRRRNSNPHRRDGEILRRASS